MTASSDMLSAAHTVMAEPSSQSSRDRPHRTGFAGDLGGHPEDAAADDGADQDCARAPDAELALEGGRLWRPLRHSATRSRVTTPLRHPIPPAHLWISPNSTVTHSTPASS